MAFIAKNDFISKPEFWIFFAAIATALAKGFPWEPSLFLVPQPHLHLEAQASLAGLDVLGGGNARVGRDVAADKHLRSIGDHRRWCLAVGDVSRELVDHALIDHRREGIVVRVWVWGTKPLLHPRPSAQRTTLSPEDNFI